MTVLSPQSNRAATRLRVAVLQTAPVLGNVDANLHIIEELTESVSHADVVLTCELSLSGLPFHPEQTPTALAVDDARLRHLGEIGPAVSVGIVESGDRLPYDSALLIGENTSVQRKLHPVSYAPWNEHTIFEPGTDLTQSQVRGVPISTLICNDAWHPVMPWLAVHRGAEVLLIPAGSMDTSGRSSEKSWDVILTHTARILQCFVVFANRVGEQGETTFWGGSRIVDPMGTVLVRAGAGQETIQADLDLAGLRRLRREVPLLKEMRVELVQSLLSELPDGDDRV